MTSTGLFGRVGEFIAEREMLMHTWKEWIFSSGKQYR